jgi:MoaD family protein
MSVSVSFASPFRGLAGGSKDVEGNGRNVGELIEALESRFPGIRASILDGQGRIYPHLNIYLNERDIGTLSGLDTPLQEGDQVFIVPAIAGG